MSTTPSPDDALALAAVDNFDPYTLLSKPTLTLTDAEVERLVTHLRTARLAYVASNGKTADKPKKAKPTAEPLTPEAKAALTLDLLGDL